MTVSFNICLNMFFTVSNRVFYVCWHERRIIKCDANSENNETINI